MLIIFFTKQPNLGTVNNKFHKRILNYKRTNALSHVLVVFSLVGQVSVSGIVRLHVGNMHATCAFTLSNPSSLYH